MRAAALAALLGLVALTGCSSEHPTAKAGPRDWPMLGRVPARTQYLPARGDPLDPPLDSDWTLHTDTLISSPPALVHGTAYLMEESGTARAVRLRDAATIWERTLEPAEPYARVDPITPVYMDGLLFFAVKSGPLIALDAETGQRVWAKRYSHLEFSPLAVDGALYVGADETRLLALDATDGSLLWAYDAEDPVYSPGFDDGRLFLPLYDGVLCSLDPATGEVLWRTDTTAVPPRPGREVIFYSPPATAFGRVYVTRNDGRLFALDQQTGALAWDSHAGGPLSWSVAAADPPKAPPTVYVGSDSGYLHALDARTGEPRWRYDTGGPPVGPPTAIGNTVYTPSGPTQRIIGVDSRTHGATFELAKVAFAPVSDGEGLYVVSSAGLTRLEPVPR